MTETSEARPVIADDSIGRIRRGYYSDQYFNRTREIVAAELPDTIVKMQVFQKKNAILGGIEEAIDTIRFGTDLQRWQNALERLTIHALPEGAVLAPWETVMTIEGPYHHFAHLETIYLGILARRTLIRTNCERVVEAANGKPVLFFPARHEHWANQGGDGYVAHLAGMAGVSTDAQASWFNGEGMGTVPHALIAAFGGDTVAAALAFARRYPEEEISVLVDFENDCARTAIEVASALAQEGFTLGAVRLDTSETLVDEGIRPLINHPESRIFHGVCPLLVDHVRSTLDEAGFTDVKIIVSGGFDTHKIEQFEMLMCPVDVYGVGSSLLRGSNDFTADIVLVDGKPCAKVGRQENPNPRLERVV